MQFRLEGNPDYGEVVADLSPGDMVYAESGAMSRMSTTVDMRSRAMGGTMAALARKFLGGESFFLGEYSTSTGGLVAFSPRHPGTVLHRRLQGETLNVTGGSFLACTPDLQMKTSFGGLKALLSREGAFLLALSGTGDLYLSAYGGVLEKEVDGSFVVDTGHVVAWEPSLDYRITGMGGMKQTLFSGEGLVMAFSGRGTVWVQSRTLNETAGWLSPFCR